MRESCERREVEYFLNIFSITLFSRSANNEYNILNLLDNFLILPSSRFQLVLAYTIVTNYAYTDCTTIVSVIFKYFQECSPIISKYAQATKPTRFFQNLKN